MTPTTRTTQTTPAATELIPAPRRIVRNQNGHGRLDEKTRLEAGPGTEGVARWLRATVGAATGFPLADRGDRPGSGHGEGRLALSVEPDLPPEGYRLVVDGPAILIQGGSAAGVFWGAQTLRQLLGPDAYRRAPRAAGPGLEPRGGQRSRTAPASAGAASCSTWPGTSCPRTASCATSI